MNQDKKVLILTGAEDYTNVNSEDSYLSVLELTLKSKKEYAKKHNYDLAVLNSLGKDEKNLLERNNNHSGFLRVLRAFEKLKNYDIVMWIDADALITNQNISIFDFGINDDQFLYASWDWMNDNKPYHNISGYSHFFSAGNFIFNKTKNIDNFINLFCTNAKYFQEEQMLLNLIYYKTQFNSNIKILDHKFLNGVPKEVFEYEEWINIIKRTDFTLPTPWSSNFFLSHVCGIKNKNRIDLIKKYYKDYI